MLRNSYWDISDILMTQEEVDCKLLKPCEFLPEILNTQETENSTQFNENEIVKLPLSICIPLSYIGALTLETPKVFSEQYYNLLQASPLVPNFSGNNQFFYEKYILLKTYLDLDESNINNWNNCIINTIFQRFLHYYNNSRSVKEINTEVERKTSFTEQTFFTKMARLNNNIKFFQENYNNNNNTLEQKIEAKRNRQKIKKQTNI